MLIMKLLALLLPAVALALPAQEARHHKPASLPLPNHVVTQFAEGTWVENIAIRSNGDLLVTTLQPSANIYQISNPSSSHPSVSLIHTFPADGLLGITETKPDVFAVVGGNLVDGLPVNGTFSAWEVDFNHKNEKPVSIRLIAPIPRAVFPNGLLTLPNHRTTILIADSSLGLIWRLDTTTGSYTIFLRLPEMAVIPTAPLPLGINGIKISHGYLYFDNGFAKTLYRIRLDSSCAPGKGAEVELVVHIPEAVGIDDFAIGDDGTIWVDDNAGNRVFAVRRDGSYVVAVGAVTELTVAGATAAAFGRDKGDGEVLYVTTTGALAAPVNGTVIEGGKVVAVHTRGSF